MASGSTKRPHVDPAVIVVVRAWALAENLEAAALALAAGRRGLDPALMPQLQTEIAEIAAHTLIEVLALEDGIEGGEEPVDVHGLPLAPKQVERISAWKHDQLPTAEALSVDLERWHALVIAGMEVVCAELATGTVAPGAAAAGNQPTPTADRVAQARALLGAESSSFENRPAPGTSKAAGLSGMLAARSFAAGDKKKS